MKIEGSADVGDKSTPKDAQVMAAILRDMGITDYEPRVINQLLEFSYRYVTTILDDARIVSGHAKKKIVDVDDVKLAVQMYTEENLTSPPHRDVLLETARIRNSVQLPMPKPTCGLRLPPERFCITAANYRLAASAKKKTVGHRSSGSSFSNQNNPGTSKILVAPPGSTLIHQQKLVNAPAMPKIQFQPAPVMGGQMIQIQPPGGQPLFNLTLNPQMGQQGNKRKAGEMDSGD